MLPMRLVVRIIVIGVVTMYSGAGHMDNPLRCGGTYNTGHMWIAVDIDALEMWECGDEVVIWSGGVQRTFLICDSGRLARHCVMWPDGECYSIGADIPEHVAWFPGLSTRATVVNKSAAKRLLEIER